MRREQNARTFRIAVVWDSSSMRSQQVLIGLYRRAEAQPELSLRRYDCVMPDSGGSIVKQLRAWRPHGVVVRFESPEMVLQIRKG